MVVFALLLAGCPSGNPAPSAWLVGEYLLPGLDSRTYRLREDGTASVTSGAQEQTAIWTPSGDGFDLVEFGGSVDHIDVLRWQGWDEGPRLYLVRPDQRQAFCEENWYKRPRWFPSRLTDGASQAVSADAYCQR